MLSEAKADEIMGLLDRTAKPWTNARVWIAVTFSTNWNTWRVTAKAPELARKARVPENEVRRSLGVLTEIGALKRIGRGVYAVNPDVSWKGDTASRGQAAREFHLVEQER